MKPCKFTSLVSLIILSIPMPVMVIAQGTIADYERADRLRSMVSGLVYDSIDLALGIQ